MNNSTTRSRQNKYIKNVNDPMNLKLYECPIFSTHNTFFEGNTFIDTTYKEIIELCKFFPVCIEIDFKPVNLKKTIKKPITRLNSTSSVNSKSSVNSNNIRKELNELSKLKQQEYDDVFNNKEEDEDEDEDEDEEEVRLDDYIILKETQVGGTSVNKVKDVPECIQCGIGHGPLSKDHKKIKYDDQFVYLNNIIETYKNINNNKYPLIITFDIEKVLSGKGLRSIFGSRSSSRSGSISSYNSNSNNDTKVKKIKETTRCLQNVSKYCEIIHKNFYENKNIVDIDYNYKNRNLSDCMNKIIVRLKDNQFEHISNLNIPYIMNEGSYGFDSQITNNDYKNIIRVYPKSLDHKKQGDISKNIVNATINMFEKEDEYKNVNMMAFNYQDIDTDKLKEITEKFTDFYKTSTTFRGGKPKTKKKKRNSSNKKKSVKKQKK